MKLFYDIQTLTLALTPSLPNSLRVTPTLGRRKYVTLGGR